MRRPNWPRFRPRMIAAMARVSATAEDWDRQVGGVDVGDVWLDVPSSFPFIKYTHLVLRCFATHWVVNDVDCNEWRDEPWTTKVPNKNGAILAG